MSRLLELQPQVLLKGGLAMSQAERKEAALALGEQLRSEGVPADALALWISMLHLAASENGPEPLERLHEGLKRTAKTAHFSAWAQALVPLLVDVASINAAIELVLAAYRLRLINDTLLGK